jgi:hypothetical protein
VAKQTIVIPLHDARAQTALNRFTPAVTADGFNEAVVVTTTPALVALSCPEPGHLGSNHWALNSTWCALRSLAAIRARPYRAMSTSVNNAAASFQQTNVLSGLPVHTVAGGANFHQSQLF